MSRKKLIVNADDFGITEGVNRAISEGHRNGIITSATLMANGRAFESAVALSRSLPRLGVGVHLNLTEGPPVSRPTEVSSLISGGGNLIASPARLAMGVLSGSIRMEEVERELRAQVEKVVAAGVPISHFDSHKHVHVLPPIFDAVIRIARKFGIQSIRWPAELGASGPPFFQFTAGQWPKVAKQYLLGRVLSSAAARQKSKLRRSGLHAADEFRGLRLTGFLNAQTLQPLLQNLPAGITELMCHPGCLDAELSGARTRLRKQREIELDALTRPELKRLLQSLDVQLITYRELANPEVRSEK